MKITTLFAFLLITITPCLAGGTVEMPKFSKEFPRADDFEVTADGQPLSVLEGEIAAMAYATIDGSTTITVVRDNPFKEVIVRPLSAGVRPRVDGNKLEFTLPKALNLSIEFDGDISRPLFLFTCPLRNNIPDKNDPKVHYFEAGKIHEAGEIRLHDNETLYMEPGAIVRATVRADNARNIKILGGGILDQSARRKQKTHTVMLTECQNILVQDVHIHDPFGWTLHPRGCDDVVIDNHKQTGWRANSDGIDIEACHRVVVRNSFLRNADDCIAVKSKDPGVVKRRGNPAVDSVLIEQSVFWNSLPGNALEIGFELMGATVQNIIFRDCDVIRVEKGAVFSIHNGGTATVRNITFENVRVEDARDELIDLYIGLSIYSEDIPEEYARRNGFNIPEHLKDPVANNNRSQWLYLPEGQREQYTSNRGFIENIVFRDIYAESTLKNPSLIKGWDQGKHSIRGVVIENLNVDGKRIEDLETADFIIENASDISLK